MRNVRRVDLERVPVRTVRHSSEDATQVRWLLSQGCRQCRRSSQLRYVRKDPPSDTTKLEASLLSWLQHFSESAHTQRVGMPAICSAFCSWTDERVPVRTVRYSSEDMTQIRRLLSQRLPAVIRLAVLAVIVVRSRRLGISRRSAWLLRGGRGLLPVVGLAVLAPVKVCAG